MNKGLKNIGNTCYLNSTLQCLFHLPHLKLNKIKKEYKKNLLNDKSLLNQWIILQNSIYNNNNYNNNINPINFVRLFIKKCNENNLYFDSFDQNDASEFIYLLIDLLHKSLKKEILIEIEGDAITDYDKLKLKCYESWRDFFKNDYSYIVETFYSESITFTSCNQCDNININHEPMMIIPLIYKNSLIESFDEYIKKYKLDLNNSWKCDNCNKIDTPYQKKIFWDFSSVLILELKQYTSHNKIDKKINYDMILNLDKYIIQKSKSLMNYKLSGLIIHNGNSNFGHYYSLCYNYNDNNWYRYNDENVCQISESDVLNENPYILFYIKQNN